VREGELQAHRIVGLSVGALTAGLAAGLPFIDAQGGYAGLSPRFLPTVVCLGLGICALLLFLRPDALPAAEPAESVAGPDRPGPARGAAPSPGPAAGRLAWVAGGLVAHAVLIGVIGFVLASALLMACAARGFGSRRPLRDVLIGLAHARPRWFVFARVFQVGLKLLPAAGI
jgi:putative tricarboxylic transport membrane protein